jgi:hypothetical protein
MELGEAYSEAQCGHVAVYRVASVGELLEVLNLGEIEIDFAKVAKHHLVEHLVEVVPVYFQVVYIRVHSFHEGLISIAESPFKILLRLNLKNIDILSM